MLGSREALKHGGTLLLGSVAGRGGSFVFRYVGAAMLPVEAYAALSLYISLFLTLSSIASFSIATTLSKLAAENRRDTAALFRNAIILISGSGLFSAAFFAYCLSSTKPFHFSAEIVICGVLGLVLFGYYQIGIGHSLAEMKFLLSSAYDAADGVTKIMALGVLLLLGLSLRVETFVFAFSLPYLALAVWAGINNRAHFSSRTGSQPLASMEIGLVKEIAGHAVAITLVSFSSLTFFFMLRYFLALSSSYEVAVFDFSLLMYSIPKMVFAALVRPVVPLVARAEYSQVHLPRIKPFVWTFFAGMAISYLALKAGWIGMVFQATGVGQYEESFRVFLVVLLGSLFDLTFGYLSSYLQGLGRVWALSSITLAVTVIAIPLSFAAVTKYHVYGAAVSCVIFFLSLSAVSLLYCRRAIGVAST